PDGTGARQLPTGRLSSGSIGLQWAPSAGPLRVAYATTPGGDSASLVAVLDIASGTERQLSSSRDVAYAPAWSPDATRLAWLGGAAPDKIVVVYVDDPSRATSLPTGKVDAPIAWSPDG